MKKFLVLMSAGLAFAFASCATPTKSCCGSCDATKKCPKSECSSCDKAKSDCSACPSKKN